jgi:hypothetical protein
MKLYDLFTLIRGLAYSSQELFMPRKLPKSYLVKLKEEQVRLSVMKKKSEERQNRQAEQGLSSATMLRSFEGNCVACGQRTLFTVDSLGYCKCNKCGSQANFRLGVA